MSYASISPPTLQAFISYAHNDEQCCEKLLRHLKLIENVVAWHDRLIAPGTHWQQELDQNLEAADIILLLITLLPQLGLDFHKNKTFCVFNPLIFRTGIFRSAVKAPVVPT